MTCRPLTALALVAPAACAQTAAAPDGVAEQAQGVQALAAGDPAEAQGSN